MHLRLQSNINRVCNLNRAKIKGVFINAKPLLILAIIELISDGKYTSNRIEILGESLKMTYNKIAIELGIVKITLLYKPFWHLGSEPFWKIVLKDGAEDLADKTVSSKWLCDNVAYVELDPMLFESIKIPEEREILKQEILKKYFQSTHK
jgi:putative restriction endonuclease